jgi:hypothetical protein
MGKEKIDLHTTETLQTEGIKLEIVDSVCKDTHYAKFGGICSAEKWKMLVFPVTVFFLHFISRLSGLVHYYR